MNELCKIRRRKGMFPQKALPPVLEFHPLTPERWKDLEALFGELANEELVAAVGVCGGD